MQYCYLNLKGTFAFLCYEKFDQLFSFQGTNNNCHVRTNKKTLQTLSYVNTFYTYYDIFYVS